METPKRRSRLTRILRWLGLVSLCWSVLLLIVWFTAGNRIIAALANRYLPHDTLSGVIITAAHAGPVSDSRDLVLRIAPGRLHVALTAAAEQSFPGWVIRSGIGVDALWNDSLYPELPLSLELWTERVADPPSLTARLDGGRVSALMFQAVTDQISYEPRLASGCTVVDDGGVEETDGGPQRRFHAKLHGSLVLVVDGDRAEIPVRNLEGTITVLFERGLDGFMPRLSVTIDNLDADFSTTGKNQAEGMVSIAAGLGKDGQKRLLETSINAALSDPENELPMLPPWFPVDVRVDAATK
jgi:hypothetical protein